MENIVDKFKHLFKVVSSQRFLNKEALGGEIPFFISTYKAKQEIEVQESIPLLINKLKNEGVAVLEINLYNIVCEILVNKGGDGKNVSCRKSEIESQVFCVRFNLHSTFMRY